MDLNQIKKDFGEISAIAEFTDEREEECAVVDVNLLFRVAVDLNMLIQLLERTQNVEQNTILS